MLCTALHCSWPDNFCRNASQLCVTPVDAFFSPADEFGDPGVIYTFSIQQSGCGSLALKAHKQEFTIGLNTSKETEWWLRIYFWASFLPLSSSFFRVGGTKRPADRLEVQTPLDYNYRHPAITFLTPGYGSRCSSLAASWGLSVGFWWLLVLDAEIWVWCCWKARWGQPTEGPKLAL